MAIITWTAYENLSYQSPNQVNHLFITDIEKENNKQFVTIEYDIDELQGAELDIFALDTPEMSALHTKLIHEKGYNLQDHAVSFFVLDKEDIDASGIFDDIARDKLRCGTFYMSTATAPTSMQMLNCKGDYHPTGCISYERDTNGIRSGEKAYHAAESYTVPTGDTSTGYIYIYFSSLL